MFYKQQNRQIKNISIGSISTQLISKKMFIFGRNPNHLIKNNHKPSFSLPQKLPLLQKQILKCICFDDHLILHTKDLKLYCYYQCALYQLMQGVRDVDGDDGMLFIIRDSGQVEVIQVDLEKVVKGQLKSKKVKLNLEFKNVKNKQINQVKMTNGLIFLKFKQNQIAYLRRNSWIQSKTFSDPQLIKQSLSMNIKEIYNNATMNYFLTYEGHLYYSSNLNPNCLKKCTLPKQLRTLSCNQTNLFAISSQGTLLKLINITTSTPSIQLLTQMKIKFKSIYSSQDNYFAISQQEQAWVWGKNGNGELGLSDYQPRYQLYPMVTMEKYYFKSFFVSSTYTTCLIDTKRYRSSLFQSLKQNHKDSIQNQHHHKIIKDINLYNVKNSINSIEQSNLQSASRIQYTDVQQKQSELNESIHKQNIIINKRQVLKKIDKSPKINSKLNQKQNKNNFKSNICSCANKSSYSNRKQTLTPKSQSRSISKSKISSKTNNFSGNNTSQLKNALKNERTPKHQINDKNEKNDKVDNKSLTKYTTPNKVLKAQVTTHVIEQIKQNHRSQIEKLTNQLNNVKGQLNNAKGQLKNAKGQLKKVESQLKSIKCQLSSKCQQNIDLFQLVKQKNLIISDITSKIHLLQSAIQQHQKTLTSRDSQAQLSYHRQKQYQQHIIDLQRKLQQMIGIFNQNDKDQQVKVYKDQVDRLHFQIKQKIQAEKQYYRQRIKNIEHNFQSQRNLYQMESRNLRNQLDNFRKREIDLLEKLNHKNELQNHNNYELYNHNKQKLYNEQQELQQVNSSSLESPKFQTVDMKSCLKSKLEILEQNYISQCSKVTMHNQPQTILQQSNRQLIPHSHIKKPLPYFSIKNQVLNQNNCIQMNDMLDRIEKNRCNISRSANKLVSLLEEDRVL